MSTSTSPPRAGCAVCGTPASTSAATTYRYATPPRLEPKRGYESGRDGVAKWALAEAGQPWLCGLCCVARVRQLAVIARVCGVAA